MARFKIIIWDEDLGEEDPVTTCEESFLSESNDEEIAETALRVQRQYFNKLDKESSDWEDF